MCFEFDYSLLAGSECSSARLVYWLAAILMKSLEMACIGACMHLHLGGCMSALLHGLNSNPSPHLRELDSSQRFCQNIRELILRPNVVDLDLAILNTVPYIMILDIYVLTPVMINRVFTQGYSRFIINLLLKLASLLICQISKESCQPNSLTCSCTSCAILGFT